MVVTVFSNEDCRACTATKDWLKKRGLPYEEKSYGDSPEAQQLAKEKGYMSAPVCITSDGDSWAGLNPGKLKEFQKKFAERA